MQFTTIAIVVLLSSLQCELVLAYKVNLSRVENCQDAKGEAEVVLYNLTYDVNPDGLVDTFHGDYEVYKIDTSDRELVITIFRCPTNSDPTIRCNDNKVEHHMPLHCHKFKHDDSGPWYTFSAAMSGSHCGAELYQARYCTEAQLYIRDIKFRGKFNLGSAMLKPDYISDYIKEVDKDFARYRMKLDFHTILQSEKASYRACVSMEFNLI